MKIIMYKYAYLYLYLSAKVFLIFFIVTNIIIITVIITFYYVLARQISLKAKTALNIRISTLNYD